MKKPCKECGEIFNSTPQHHFYCPRCQEPAKQAQREKDLQSLEALQAKRARINEKLRAERTLGALPEPQKCREAGCETLTRHITGRCAEHVHLTDRRVSAAPRPRTPYLYEEMRHPHVRWSFMGFKL